jgi:hypothetical protein
MVRKEIALHAIVYNLVRALMQQAAALYQVDLDRIRFKGSVDALRQWAERRCRSSPSHFAAAVRQKTLAT